MNRVVFRSLMVLLAMMPLSLFAQNWPDGIYYIKHDSWYLWPSVVRNTYSNNYYLTTYNAILATAVAGKYETHDSTWCVWVVKNVTVGENHYIQLINPKLNQYVVIYDKSTVQTSYQNAYAYGDRDVWLSSELPTDITRTYFKLTNATSNSPYNKYRISPTQGYNGTNTTDYANRSFNSAANDKSGLGSGGNGTDLTDTRAGLIQLYDGDPKWTIEPALLPAPTITYDEDQRYFTFSYDQIASGFDILYTTNGNDPTVGGEGVQTYSGGNVYATEVCTVKAVVARYGLVLSAVSSQAVQPAGTPPDPVITVSDPCTNTITITPAGPTIYYTTDGSTPSNSNGTLYSGAFQQNSSATIRAVAYFGTTHSDNITSFSHTAKTAMPAITVNGNTVTITGTGSIYYTIDGSEPSTGSSQYTAPIVLADGQGTLTIKAAAKESAKELSCAAQAAVKLARYISTIGQLNSITSDDDCLLTADIDASTYTGNVENFTGTFDGGMHVISGLTKPLFQTVTGGVVRNVLLKEVSISREGDVGAVACDAKGYTRIYNCGILPTTNTFPDGTRSSVTSTGGNGSAGGIVGKLDGDSRVVNCFSYADVSSTGYAAGIVGNNTFSSTAAVTGGKYTNLRTMVVNCVFYGDITSGSQVWAVYGGSKITNSGATSINNYNFYSEDCSFSPSLQAYNCSWPVKQEYLTRYEFVRYLLNSNRELCGWWVGAPSAPSTMDAADVQAVAKDASLMAKWVLDRSVAPYPILKSPGYYPSPVNIDADATWRTTANKWEGKKLGTLSVTIKSGSRHSASDVTLSIPVTDMDTLKGDYCYRKIQLPYYNSVFGNPSGTTWETKYAGNYSDYVVTGWEVTDVTGGTPGTLSQNWETGYNFADRDCTNKDKYSLSGRIFAQGGYYYVPNGVTAIIITAHWGKAVYLDNGDSYYDRVDFKHDNNKPGTAFAPAGVRPTTLGNGQNVRTGKIADVATNYIPASGTVFDNALVLVGNHQYCTGGEDVAPACSFTIMSADFDLDNEPDYCLEWQLGVGTTRQAICPIRFDFLPVVEIGLGLKKDGSTQYYSLGCYQPQGYYEVTETALIRFGQFEFGSRRTEECPLILNGGIFEQYTKGTTGGSNASNDKINYIIIGGNVMMPSFTPGSHVNNNYTYSTRHCAVNVIGGKFDYLYLTGNYNDNVTPNSDNPHCYIDGGWFGQVAAAGKEGIKGDVFFTVNHAVIHEFYGGGTLADKRVTGSISVAIDSSVVSKYCGGPKFGDMYDGKTVTTSATGTNFGVYYGGGNGGTSYVQYYRTDGEQSVQGYNWNTTGKLDDYTPTTYRNATTGYMADYELTITNVSTGTNSGKAIYRSYFFAAQFSATNTGSVTNTLTGCTVEQNFYGGGNLGGVLGDVTSTLTDTKVMGSAFGAGFSASIPTVTIYNKDKTPPSIDVNTGIIKNQKVGTYSTYTWTNSTSGSTGSPVVDGQYFFTERSLEGLGTVTGHVQFTIKGSSEIGTIADADMVLGDGTSVAAGSLIPGTGNVYGGGDESAVSGNTEVVLQQGTTVRGSVFGGGNQGPVGGNSSVTVQDPAAP